MNSSQPCTGYWPYTIVISPRKQYSTSCNSITPILRSGLRMRPHRYQGALRSWNAFMNPNNKTWSMAASPNDGTPIGVMQGINGYVKPVFDSSRADNPWGPGNVKRDAPTHRSL